ncbi:MAG: hypothetical protein AAF214_00265 [Pseudomonadota bacterium]
MQNLRRVVGAMVAVLVVYTLVVMVVHGPDLLTPFFGDLVAVNWSGQFNLDFSLYLVLSTLWFVWRNGFSRISLICAPVVLVGGMLVFGCYLIWQSTRVEGRMDVLLLGPGRAPSD